MVACSHIQLTSTIKCNSPTINWNHYKVAVMTFAKYATPQKMIFTAERWCSHLDDTTERWFTHFNDLLIHTPKWLFALILVIIGTLCEITPPALPWHSSHTSNKMHSSTRWFFNLGVVISVASTQPLCHHLFPHYTVIGCIFTILCLECRVIVC